MAEKQKIIMPGESIATEEEYVPRANAFSENGVVKSKIIGVANFDNNNREVSVKGKGVKGLIIGDIVVGKVTLVKESTAVIELVSAENDKKIMGMKTAQLPIRNVSTEYISELKKVIKIGDLVRARIVAASPLAIDLATNEKGLGIIKAYCSKCRSEMQYSNEKLMCLSCGNVEERKWFEAEQKPREFNQRQGGFNSNRGPRREGQFGNDRGFRPRNDRGFRPRGQHNNSSQHSRDQSRGGQRW